MCWSSMFNSCRHQRCCCRYRYIRTIWCFVAHISLCAAHRLHKGLHKRLGSQLRKAVRTQSSRFGHDPCSMSRCVACVHFFFSAGMDQTISRVCSVRHFYVGVFCTYAYLVENVTACHNSGFPGYMIIHWPLCVLCAMCQARMCRV